MISALFASPLKRTDLLKIPRQKINLKIKVAVYRNHSFEMIASVLNSFLNFSGIEASFIYSDYDDSLNFQQINDADLNLIWVDVQRYKTKDIGSFLSERVSVLSEQTGKPVLLAYTGDKIDLNLTVSDAFSFCVDDYLIDFGSNAYDEEKEAFSGTRLSNKSALEIGRVLGLKYFPAIFKPHFKAIVLDLDNTLYRGILGEDGIDALKPDLELQKQIKTFKESGLFICLCSKNELQDVQALFEKRKDFLLRWDDFAAVQINWAPKSENILKLADKLNIGTDAMLFIDDNPAEIENVSSTGVTALLAQENISEILKYYPGLMKLRLNVEDALRSKDTQANIERTRLAKTLSKEDYFKKLGIKLTFAINDQTQIPRVAELFGKTNQFLLNYKRYRETEVSSYMQTKDRCIITIDMSDNLSDSGIIAILAAHRENKSLYVDELTVSCRALGRNLENVMLPELLRLAQKKLQTETKAVIAYQKGERNTPALKWLEELTGKELFEKGTVDYMIPKQLNLDGLTVKVR